jgi:hypothetical protein
MPSVSVCSGDYDGKDRSDDKMMQENSQTQMQENQCLIGQQGLRQ